MYLIKAKLSIKPVWKKIISGEHFSAERFGTPHLSVEERLIALPP
jgi:hypothetical protein